MTDEKKANAPKVKKKKGPLRLEVILPSILILALIYGYFFFFFDSHLRKAGEYALTQVHGAEVNIGNIQTSFLNASLVIQKIQITDKNQPERDLFRIGEVRFKTLWDGLLRAKVAIEEASIKNIQALVPRDRPGRVLPPPPPDGKPGLIAKAEKEIVDQTKAKLQDNFLGDILAVVNGVDVKDQLKSLEGDLKASLRIKELDAELKKKKEEWDQRLKSLPESDYFKSLETRFKALNWNEKDPIKFANNLQTANNLVKEAKSKVEEIDKAQKDLRGDLGNYGGSIKDLEGFIQQDIKDLQKRFNIPSIDPKSISQQFFMKQIEERLVGTRKYYEVAKKYMPPKFKGEKTKEPEETLVPRKRGEGKNFTFPITKGYPKFWLKKAFISSEVSSSEYSGNITGEVLDVTSHPQYLKRPTKINISGDFPQKAIYGLDLKSVIDFTTDTPKQTVDLKLASFPIGKIVLSESSDAGLAMSPSKAALQVNAQLTEGQIMMDTKSQYNEVKYDIQAKEKFVSDLLTNIFTGIPTVTLNAKISGAWSDLKININSNLGEELARGFGKQLQAKIDEAKQRIREEIDKQIGQEKQKLQEQIKGLSGDISKSLGVRKSEVDKVIKDLEDGIKKEGNGLIKKDDMKKLEEEGKKLLKGLGL